MSNLSATYANLAVKAILDPGTTYYASLHSTTPGTTGAHEVTGGSYARQPIKMGTPTTGKETSETTAQTFTGLPATPVKFMGWWTALSGGDFIVAGALATAITAPAGSTIKFAVGTASLKVS